MLTDDLILAVGILRNGDASPAEQRALFGKIAHELAPKLRRKERFVEEAVIDEQEDELRRAVPMGRAS